MAGNSPFQFSYRPPQPRPHLTSPNLRVLCNARQKLKSIQNIVNIAILPRFLSRFSPFELPAEEASTRYSFNPNWEINSNQNNELNEVIDDISKESQGHNLGKNTLTEEDDEISEDEAEILTGVTDSMLTPPDFVDDSKREHVLNVAPREGNRLLSVFTDKYSEELFTIEIFVNQN